MEQELYQHERYEAILAIISRLKKVSVQDLTHRFGVSEVTIRKDLSFLEERGKLIRIHGGAMLAEDEGRLRTIAVRQAEHSEEKLAIARKARELIRSGETIFIDAGSTCAALARVIRDMELRVITNSLDAILELVDSAGISLFSTGGSFRPEHPNPDLLHGNDGLFSGWRFLITKCDREPVEECCDQGFPKGRNAGGSFQVRQHSLQRFCPSRGYRCPGHRLGKNRRGGGCGTGHGTGRRCGVAILSFRRSGRCKRI